jgi:transglutaminase-like putative cysteine protease
MSSPAGKPQASLNPVLQLPLLRQIWQRIQSQPLPEPEDSIPLRVLVQGLVTVGIVAIDVAAADSTDTIGLSLWAVPVSTVGAVWSTYRRRKRNIPVKFCIAIGMLLALALFFMRIWVERNDTRIALATLLIHLQVFHSFDTPRRKDLGYSAVIGLILIGVAATLSQTLAFAPVLLLFLGLAIPVLILNYRSQIGLASPTLKQVRADLAPKRIGWVLLVVMSLGLGIFLLLPRFPGYQIRTFPVSAEIPLQQEFNQSQIVNSGYVQPGRSTGVGNGAAGDLAPTKGAGTLNSQSYYGFNTKINQNLRGVMQPQVVMRIRSQAPGFWRMLAFDRYTGQGWEISRNQEAEVQKLERPSWTFRFSLPWSITLNRTREVVQSYTVVADLPNLIPALYEVKELYFPTNQIAIDPESGLRSPVSLSEGLTYTVISAVPYRDRTQLRSAPQNYLNELKPYVQLPADVAARVRQKTEAILARSPKPLNEHYEKALFLAQYLKQNYKIQPNLPFLEDGEDLAEAFLFKYEGGYPDHFATTLTVMLRSIGIPARLVVGFSPGEFNPFTGYYVVRNTDAHAITEVYFHKFGWFSFDPIPGHPLIPPSIEESSAFGVLQQFWNWIAGWLPSPLTGWLNGIFERLGSVTGWAIGWLLGLFTRGWVGLFLGVGLLTGLGFLGWLFWQGWQQWRYQHWLRRLPPMEAIYQQMLRWLDHQGFRKPIAQTPLEYAHACQNYYPLHQAKAIEEITEAYVRWRYGRETPNLPYLKQCLRQVRRKSSI